MTDISQQQQEQQGQGQESGGDLRNRLETTLDENKTLKGENTGLKRDLAFLRAGVPETGTGALVRKAYDGEPDVEKVRAFATEHGIDLGEPTAPAGATTEAGTADGQQQQATNTEPAPVDQTTQQAAAATQAAMAGQAPNLGGPSLTDRINATQTQAELDALLAETGMSEVGASPGPVA